MWETSKISIENVSDWWLVLALYLKCRASVFGTIINKTFVLTCTYCMITSNG